VEADFEKISLGAGGQEKLEQALPKARVDVEITEQVYYGKSCYILKDPAALRYYRLRPPEYAIYRMLDGKKRMEDIQKVLAERFPGEEFDSQAIMSFIIMLRGGNLLQTSGPQGTEYLLKRRERQKRGFFKKLRQEFLFYRIPLLDPDKVLGWLERWGGGLIFSRFTLWILVLLVIGAAWLLLGNIDKLGLRQPLLSWINLLYVLPILIVIKVIHEIGHGLTSKHFGCEVHEMGILFLVFMPCAYCDVSDAWMIPAKARRMAITAAGIVVEITLAALATYVWALTEPKTVWNQLALNAMVVSGLNTLLFNGNPLLRYDGYYFLMDLMEIPNLKQKGTDYLWYLLQRGVLGVEDATEPLDVRGREAGVFGYAICSAIYRWFIMFAIVTMVWRFLDPYGWGVVGGVMALGCIFNAFVTPLIKFGRFLAGQRQRIHLRAATAVILILVIAGSSYGFLALPVEQSVEAQCVLRAAKLHPLYVTQAGFIDAERNGTFVEDGREVVAGQELLVLSEPQLEQKYQDLKLQLEQLETEEKRVQEQGAAGLEMLAQIKAKIEGLRAQYQRLEQDVGKLTICAPVSGVIQMRTDMPLKNLSGSFLPVGTALFAVYEPGQFEAVAAVNHRDNGLIDRDQQVQIKLWALDSEVFESKVVEKAPEPVRKMSSAAFSTVFHGEVPTMPAADKEEALEPAEPTYELEFPLADAEGRLRDGMVGRAKIIVQERTLGGAFYRWLIRTLRLDIRL